MTMVNTAAKCDDGDPSVQGHISGHVELQCAYVEDNSPDVTSHHSVLLSEPDQSFIK